MTQKSGSECTPDKGSRSKHHVVELSDCLEYLLFLILFTSICILGRSYGDLNYHATQSQRIPLIKSDMAGGQIISQGEKGFYDISHASDIWAFQSQVVLPHLFRQSFVEQKAHLQGGIKLRLIRHSPSHCKQDWNESLGYCFPTWTSSNGIQLSQDKLYQYKYAFPVNYGSTTSNDESPYWYGLVDTYPGSGYTVDLPYNQSLAQNRLKYLEEQNFLGPESKVLFIDYSHYNPFLQIHTLTRQVFEFPISGGIIPHLEVKTWNFKRYLGSRGDLLFALEIILCLVVLKLTFDEIREWCKCWSNSRGDLKREGENTPNQQNKQNKQKTIKFIKRCKRTILSYLSDRWNYIDSLNLVFFWATFSLRIYQYRYLQHRVITSVSKYTSLRYLHFLFTIEVHLMLINGFLLWIKMFKYFTFSKRIRFLFAMFDRVGIDLLVFCISLLVFVLAFATTAFLSFSSDVYEFSSFSRSILNLIRYIVSDMNSEQLSVSDTVFGPIFYCSWNLLMILVLANIFIAILNDAYAIVNGETRDESFSFQGIKASPLIRYLGFFKSFKEVDKNGDGQVSRDELSVTTGISKDEATSVITIFDQDGDGMLNSQEVKNLRQSTQQILPNVSVTVKK